MANTIKAYNHPNGFIYLDCGNIRGVRTGYAISDTGAVEITGDELTNNIAGLEEAYFDVILQSKVDNAIHFTEVGKPVDQTGLSLIMALINEKAEDGDGPTT